MKNKMLGAYIARNHKGLLTESDLVVLNADTLDEIVDKFIRLRDDKYNQLMKCVLGSMDYFLDSELVLEGITESHVTQHAFLGTQIMDGEDEVFLGIAGTDEALCAVASDFALERFTEFDVEVYDAICELINCINGKYATKLSENDIELVIHPPAFYENVKVNASNKLYLITMSLNNVKFDVIMAINGKIELVTNK